jgi:hypothetical protein
MWPPSAIARRLALLAYRARRQAGVNTNGGEFSSQATLVLGTAETL